MPSGKWRGIRGLRYTPPMRTLAHHRPFGILHRYVLREIAVPSLLAFALISFLAVGNELRERIEQIRDFRGTDQGKAAFEKAAQLRNGLSHA